MRGNEKKTEQWEEIRRFEKILIELLGILGVLNAQEKEILVRYYGMYQKPETLEKIGSSFRVSRERIRQIRDKAEKRIRFFAERRREFTEERILGELTKISQRLGRIEEILIPVEKSTVSDEMLFRPIKDLELSVRPFNCLRSAGISTIGELISETENTLLMLKNFGRKSLHEIRNMLAERGLSLRKEVDHW